MLPRILTVKKKNILDVGTGAGLPGIPLAVVVPSCNITLLDQKIKKITFVRHAVNVLQLSNVSIAAERVERFTGKFDLIISRAFSDLQDFVRLSKHLCAKQGILVAMKSDPSFFVVGADCGEGYKIIEVKELKVPGVSAKRSLVIIAK